MPKTYDLYLRVADCPYVTLYLQLFPIYNELASNTQKRMNLVIGASLGSATIAYEVISIFGYITFGTNVSATFQHCPRASST